MILLDYVQWRNFENVVKKGMIALFGRGSLQITENKGERVKGYYGRKDRFDDVR